MKISVIVPVYNTAPYLKKCFDSLLDQNYPDFEILAVDDGSTDESPALLDALARENPGKLRVFHKENGGPSDARNFGVREAAGDAVAFVDSDDRVLPGFLEKMAFEMEKGADLVQCRMAYENPDGTTFPVRDRSHLASAPDRLFILSDPGPCCRLYRKELFSHLSFRKGIFYEDLECCPAFALYAEKIVLIPEILYYYFRRPGSTMKSAVFRPYMTDIFTVLPSLLERFRRAGREKEYEKELEFLFIEHLLHSAALTFCPFPEGKEAFRRIRSMMNEYYPGWKKNEYYRKSRFAFRLIVRLAWGGHRRLLRCLSALRG